MTESTANNRAASDMPCVAGLKVPTFWSQSNKSYQ